MEVEYLAIDELEPFSKNPKRHPESQIDKIKKSMQEFGWTNPILISKDNMIVAGHGRYEAAKQLGFEKVPIINIDLPYEKAVAYVIADNRLAEIAEQDDEQLSALLQEIDESMYEAIGYDEEAIDELLAGIEAANPTEVEEDEAPEPPEEPVTQLGDVYVLGNHRLMCGDSTDSGDVATLMDDALANLVITDPPYNVSYVGKTKDALTIENDTMQGEDFYNFLYEIYSRLFDVSHEGAGIYVFHADSEGMNFRKAMVDAGYKLAQCCIWVKNSMVMGRQDYHWQHEPVLVGWKPGAAHNWYSDRKQTTVWEFDRPTSSQEHPTMKPIALVAYPLQNSSKKGDLVLDLFGGSGSTMMACEQTGRINYSMELDPKYCDVIVQRYVNYTGNNKIIRNGENYTWKGDDE
jgi:DNA modification methylase